MYCLPLMIDISFFRYKQIFYRCNEENKKADENPQESKIWTIGMQSPSFS